MDRGTTGGRGKDAAGMGIGDTYAFHGDLRGALEERDDLTGKGEVDQGGRRGITARSKSSLGAGG